VSNREVDGWMNECMNEWMDAMLGGKSKGDETRNSINPSK
jgi:hypothetical protein